MLGCGTINIVTKIEKCFHVEVIAAISVNPDL